jgi:hypothetical protein
LTHSTDVLPTLLDLCGLTKPAGARFDGMSLAGLVNAKTNALPDRKIVIQYKDFGRPGVVLWKKWRLVHNRELYNLADDPGQKTNVIDAHPEVARSLRDHYARWRGEMAPLQKQVNLISIGVASEPTTFLSSANWIGSYADSWGNLRGRGAKNGYWDIQVEQSGRYEIALYGWPKGSGAAMDASFKRLPARAVAEARLKIGDREVKTRTSPGDMNAAFTVSLTKGDKPRLQTWFHDKAGKDLGGSYFVYVTKR